MANYCHSWDVNSVNQGCAEQNIFQQDGAGDDENLRGGHSWKKWDPRIQDPVFLGKIRKNTPYPEKYSECYLFFKKSRKIPKILEK